MPIDPNIALQARLPQFENPLSQMAQVSQLKSAQNQNRLADLMFAEKERAAQFEGNRRNALTSALNRETGEIDEAAYTKGLAGIGDYEGLQSFRKSQAEQQKLQREAQKARLEMGLKQFEAMGQIMGGVKDQASYDAARQEAAALLGPEAAANMSTVYDPAAVEQNRLKAMTIQQQLEQQWKALGHDLELKKFGETKRSNQVSERTAQANLELKREEVGLKRHEVSAGGKPPPGYRWKGDGSLEPIPGGPAVKASQGTEGEKTAAGYGLRMQEAEKILSDVISKDATAQKPGVLENATGGTGVVANVLRGPQRQRYRQAQEDWVRAKLRKESGAVIADEEMDREISVYFPQIGDSKEVIQQKAQARQVAIAAMDQAAGQAAGKANVPPSGQGADIDALLKKYGG